ncbi:hypothetical protein ACKWTF_015991 [Chironomus riparius]
MIARKVLFSLVLIFCCIFVSTKDFQYIKVRQFKCEFNESFMFKNSTCFAKPVSRNASAITIFIFTVFPIDFLIELSFLFKYTNIYREVLKFPRINYCESTKHIDANPLFKEFTKIMYNTNPNLFIDCPTTKVIFNNTIVKIDTLPSIFPRGDYKVILHITDSKSMKEFLIIQAMVTIVSSELETFG